jgi:hypothetical protein
MKGYIAEVSVAFSHEKGGKIMTTNKKFNNEFCPVHPLNKRMKRLGIKQIAVSRWLEIPMSTLCGYLCGYNRMPDHIETKITNLCKKVARERVSH